ncbi:hypothetical protein H8356DRAFT_1745337 [Neocallimastix lanati (nom. inval.)]|nr:hypothetical protein H8356DRAFT_1745337 [Neocallimastix sp. JGI-2020a]
MLLFYIYNINLYVFIEFFLSFFYCEGFKNFFLFSKINEYINLIKLLCFYLINMNINYYTF